MKNIRAASVQFNHIAGDKQANLAIVRTYAELAAAQDVQLICFPEMCLTGYWHVRKLSREEVDQLAEPIPGGDMFDCLMALSRQHNITIGAGLIERGGGGALFNTYLVAMPDGTHARHRKLHTFISKHMTSGDAYTVFDTPHGARVGVLTCYDNNIIENARITALMGAEILMAPHQTGGCRSRSPRAMGAIDPALWNNRAADPAAVEREFQGSKGRGWLMRWLPSRAHDNGMFLLFSNGVGTDDDEVRTGNAMIIDCYGEIIAESRSIENDMVIADLDASQLADCTGRRWMQVRRPDLYAPITTPTGSERDVRIVRLGE